MGLTHLFFVLIQSETFCRGKIFVFIQSVKDKILERFVECDCGVPLTNSDSSHF